MLFVYFMVTAVRPEAEENKTVCLPFPTVKFQQKYLDRPFPVLKFHDVKICPVGTKPDLVSGTGHQERKVRDQSLGHLPER